MQSNIVRMVLPVRGHRGEWTAHFYRRGSLDGILGVPALRTSSRHWGMSAVGRCSQMTFSYYKKHLGDLLDGREM